MVAAGFAHNGGERAATKKDNTLIPKIEQKILMFLCIADHLVVSRAATRNECTVFPSRCVHLLDCRKKFARNRLALHGLHLR